MRSVSVIVVSFSTRELLRRCLASLGDAHEVWVVDNASSDGSAEMVVRDFPDARLIVNAANVGFGAANNQALRLASGDLALLLNSDAAARPSAIHALSNAFLEPRVVAAGGRLLSPDGSTQDSTANRLTLWAVFCEQTGVEKVFRRSAWLSPYWTTRRLTDTGKAVLQTEQVMGACLMMRRIGDAFLEFDERFFLYCEDTELCHRLRAHGHIVYVPAAAFEHELGASSRSDRWRSIARYNRGKELFFQVHRGRLSAGAAWLMHRFGAALRLVVWVALAFGTLGAWSRARQAVETFARVLFSPLHGPPPADR